MLAQVYKSGKRDFLCRKVDSKELITATAKGNLLKNDETVVVGDFVQLDYSSEHDEYSIISVEDRKSEIYRMLVREKRKKVTAANCDLLVILMSVSKPVYKRGIVDRFLVRAYQWGVQPLVVFNKMDEHSSDEVDISFEEERLKELGVHCFELSAKFPDYQNQFLAKGFNELQVFLEGKLAVFLGQSGVGKSKTISALSGGSVDLRTKQIGKGGKGSHTTTWSEIIDCHKFSLMDSPGIRSFSLEDMDPDELLAHFPDLADIATKCQFRNCEHEESSKGCAFYDLEEGRQRELILSRLESYKRIKEEVSVIPEWKKR